MSRIVACSHCGHTVMVPPGGDLTGQECLYCRRLICENGDTEAQSEALPKRVWIKMRSGQRKVSGQALAEALRAGRLSERTLIRLDPAEEWKRAEEIPAFDSASPGGRSSSPTPRQPPVRVSRAAQKREDSIGWQAKQAKLSVVAMFILISLGGSLPLSEFRQLTAATALVGGSYAPASDPRHGALGAALMAAGFLLTAVVVGIYAVYRGSKSLREIQGQAAGGTHRGRASLARALGVIGTVISCCVLLLIFLAYSAKADAYVSALDEYMEAQQTELELLRQRLPLQIDRDVYLLEAVAPVGGGAVRYRIKMAEHHSHEVLAMKPRLKLLLEKLPRFGRAGIVAEFLDGKGRRALTMRR